MAQLLVLLLAVGLATANAGRIGFTARPGRRPAVFHDMDTGIDDLSALAAVVASRGFTEVRKVVGLSTTDGLCPVDDGAFFLRRASYMMSIFGKDGRPVPLAQGLATPDVGTHKFPANWENDNLAVVEAQLDPLPDPVSFYEPFMDEFTEAFSAAGCIPSAPCTLLATGPLTNIGSALINDVNKFTARSIDKIVFAGANRAITWGGVGGACPYLTNPNGPKFAPNDILHFNKTPPTVAELFATKNGLDSIIELATWQELLVDCQTKGLQANNHAELNLYIDPTAAAAVFESGLPIVVYGQEVTKADGMVMTDDPNYNRFPNGTCKWGACSYPNPPVFAANGPLGSPACPSGKALQKAGKLIRELALGKKLTGSNPTLYDMTGAIGLLRPDLFVYECATAEVSVSFGIPAVPNVIPDTSGSVINYKAIGPVGPWDNCPAGQIKFATALVDPTGNTYWQYVAKLVYDGCTE